MCHRGERSEAAEEAAAARRRAAEAAAELARAQQRTARLHADLARLAQQLETERTHHKLQVNPDKIILIFVLLKACIHIDYSECM